MTTEEEESIAPAVRIRAVIYALGGCGPHPLQGRLDDRELLRGELDLEVAEARGLGLLPRLEMLRQVDLAQRREASEGARLLEDALDLEAAGAFAIVLELVPTPLASLVTQQLRVPTIGIGAGAGCDGQVLVLHDMLGLTTDFRPRHAKRYVEAAEVMQKAVERFVEEVRVGAFPADEHTTTMDESLLPEPSRRSRFELPSV